METLPAFYEPIKGLQVVASQEKAEGIEVIAFSMKKAAVCPRCGCTNNHKHSRYWRTLRDLPVSGKQVTLVLRSNKWFCLHRSCPVRVFTERLEGISSSKRNTDRLQLVLQELAFSMSAKAAERCSRAMGTPTSHDTFLYLIRAAPEAPIEESPFRRYR
ncbi:transposase family protein [Marinococcus halotolerans]|uniref:transposase family protein n=1 Tax=Marinococcus halotolerans TaxID=301092 RepID=UPI0003B30CDE|nr:transposase family protein [Marinococcus halotolerans]